MIDPIQNTESGLSVRTKLNRLLSGAQDIPTFLDAAERLDPGSYPDGVIPGVTRCFQSDLPGILFTAIATDVTLDASWIGQPYTVDPDGTIIVSPENIDGITVTGQSLITAADAEAVRTASGTESTTQLDARDTANRARANHTGTQAISTVSGLQPALDALNVSAHEGGAYFETTGAAALAAGMMDFGTGDFAIVIDRLELDDYTPATAGELLSTHSAGNNRLVISLLPLGVLRLVFTDNSAATANYDIAPTTALVDGTPYSIALVADRDGNATLYVDGVANGSVDISSASDIDIGSGNTNAGELLTDSNLSGIVSGLAPFNRALSAAEAAALHTQGLLPWLAVHPEYQWARDIAVTGNTLVKWFGTGTISSATNTSAVIDPGASSLAIYHNMLTWLRANPGQTVAVTMTISGIESGSILLKKFSSVGGSASVTTALSNGTNTYFLTVTDVSGWLQFSVNSVAGGSLLIDKVVLLGALAALPMTDGANSVLRDISTNRSDILLSETGTQHLIPQVVGSVRGDNLDATGGAYLQRAGDIIDAATTITGVTVDGRYEPASGAQDTTYRRIRYVTSGSDVLIQRSNGTTHQTIATVTPTATDDFALVVHTQRI